MSFNLITFGCSWTYGRGVGYENGMSREEYRKISYTKEICDKYSFRGILTERWGCKNINYASSGSSNMKQFRHALEHFKDKPKKKTIVLWGITSLFRHEVWCNDIKGYNDILYGYALSDAFIPSLIKSKYGRKEKKKGVDVNQYLKYHFDIENQTQILCDQMNHWNLFFESIGVENYWMDTFDHHNYPCKISRMLFDQRPRRDLLSIISNNQNEDKYHDIRSLYLQEKNAKNEAERKGIVNPFTCHPTKESHIKIADSIDEEINLINNIR